MKGASTALGLGTAAAALVWLAGSEQSDPHQAVSTATDGLAARLRARADLLRAPLDGWPLPVDLVRVGRGIGPDTNGIDLYAPAGTEVFAPEPARILRVVDGTHDDPSSSRGKAGLFVDALGRADRVLRSLHLAPGSVRVTPGQWVRTGELIAQLAARGESGIQRDQSHLHFEVRASDWNPRLRGGKGDYGAVLNPADLLPDLGPPEVQRRVAALRTQRRDVTS